jgi:hypothetical protein
MVALLEAPQSLRGFSVGAGLTMNRNLGLTRLTSREP